MSKLRGSGTWRPTRTNTQSSIRGRIGPPIPMADDDEFPIRTPGTGMATSLEADGKEQQMRLRTSTATELDHTAEQPGTSVEDKVDSPQSISVPSEPRREAPSPPRGGNSPRAARNSVASVPSRSSVGPPQRKKSTLKSVLGRFFRKRRKGSRTSSKERERSPSVRVGHHRSDPTALSRPSNGGGGSQKRSASLPINEYNRALRSHSTIADTDGLPKDNASQTNQGSIQSDRQSRSRRATTPSRIWAPAKIPRYEDWTGLSPRPASSQARGSKAVSSADADANIGLAVTSSSNPHRRSRSLGELRAASSETSAPRRRSDEIRYWRESYDPGILSPMSSNKAEAEEPIVLSDDAGDQALEPEELPQPFNFGPLGEMAGMKITQAASLESRVQQLESQVHSMERAVKRIYRSQASDALQLQDPPRRPLNKFSRTSFSRPRTDTSGSLSQLERHQEASHSALEPPPRGNQPGTSSVGSSRPVTVDTNVSHDPSIESFSLSNLPTSDAVSRPSQHTARPLSTSTTIRGQPSSSPTIPKDGSFTAEHFAYLNNMILAEQHARQQLEALVHSLQLQLRAMRSSASASYPTPISDHATGTRSSKPVITSDGFSSFEHDSSDDEAQYGVEEAFQTPAEERVSFGDDTFGAVMGTGEPRAAPRTMSLSQMTLGKGAQAV